MSRRRLLALASIAYVVVALGLLGLEALRELDDPGDSDVPAFLTGAALVTSDPGHLYDVDAQRGVQSERFHVQPPRLLEPFVSPPPVALLVAPLAPLEARQAAAALVAAAAVLLAVGFLMLRAPAQGIASEWRTLIRVMGLLPLPALFSVAQMDPVVLVALLGGVALLGRDRQVLAGLALSVMLIKPQTVWLLPAVLLVCGRWRAVAGFAGGALVQALVSIGLVGPHGLGQLAAIAGGPGVGDPRFSIGLASAVAAAGAGRAIAYWAAPALGAGTVVAAARVRTSLASSPALLCGVAVIGSMVSAPHVEPIDTMLAVPSLLVLAERHPGRAALLSGLLAPAFALWHWSGGVVPLVSLALIAIAIAALRSRASESPAKAAA